PDTTETKPRSPAWSPSPGYHRYLFSLALAGDVGTTPTPTWGGEAALRVTLGPIRWEPFGAYYTHQRGTVANQPNMGAEFTFATVGLRGCYDVVGAAAWLSPCLGAGWDVMMASGFGALQTKNPTTWTANVRAGLIASWSVTRFVSPRLEIEGV